MPNVIPLIESAGYLGVFAIVFAESGLMLGFMLPGDSLLFAVGILSARGFFDLRILIPLILLAAIAGDNTGYLIGRKLGRKVFTKNTFIFNRENLRKAEDFFDRHGKVTVIVGRFIPVVRAFAPLLAGVGGMEQKTFILFDAVGAILWGAGVTALGYFLGSVVPNIDAYLLPIIAVIIIASLLPSLYGYSRQKMHGRRQSD